MVGQPYSTTTSIQSVEENCTHDHSYYVKNTSVTKNCTHDHSYVKNTSVTKIPVIDHSKANARVIIAMQMWLNLGINIKISMLGTIPMHALWRKVVLFIINIMKNQLSPILKLNRMINRIVWLEMVFFMITCQTRGSALSWACVAHLSFCSEET